MLNTLKIKTTMKKFTHCTSYECESKRGKIEVNVKHLEDQNYDEDPPTKFTHSTSYECECKSNTIIMDSNGDSSESKCKCHTNNTLNGTLNKLF